MFISFVYYMLVKMSERTLLIDVK